MARLHLNYISLYRDTYVVKDTDSGSGATSWLVLHQTHAVASVYSFSESRNTRT